MTQFKLFSTAILIFLVSGTLLAQPPAPRPGPPPPPPAGQHALEKITSLNGSADGWIINDDHLVEGFYLQTGGNKIPVKFPAHLAASVRSSVKSKATSVTVKGIQHTDPQGQPEIRMIGLTAGATTVQDSLPPAPVQPEAGQAISGSGQISALQKNREGEVSGYVLENKTILRVPPHVSRQLTDIAAQGSRISYTGIKKNIRAGEVSEDAYAIIHCQTLTVNGTQYLTQ